MQHRSFWSLERLRSDPTRHLNKLSHDEVRDLTASLSESSPDKGLRRCEALTTLLATKQGVEAIFDPGRSRKGCAPRSHQTYLTVSRKHPGEASYSRSSKVRKNNFAYPRLHRAADMQLKPTL